MINLTVLSFISSSLITHSPAFVSNHLSLSNCNFQKFSSLIFYNQNSLYLRGSSFIRGLSGIISIDSNTQIKDELHENDRFTYQNITFNEQLELPNQIASISIIQCLFNNVKTFGLSTPHLLFLNSFEMSLYITDTAFNYCTSESGLLFLQSCLCFTMTHTCCFHSECDNSYSFFYYDSKDDSFLIFLYSTIVGSELSSNQDRPSVSNTFCKNGNQYYKCLNMTDCSYKGFEFDLPNCYTFAFNSIMNCDYYSFCLFGNYYYNINEVKLKINNVNVFSEKEYSALISISMQGAAGPIYIYFEDCVLLATN